jgi:hypothetical protein
MDIFILLREIAAQAQAISLLNVFQGVPISYPASITDVGERSVRVRTEKYQLACLYRERETFVQSKFLPEILRAKVLKLDLAVQEVTLAEFAVVKGQVGDRMEVRVQPKDPIAGKVKTAELRIPVRAELADISRDGLGIYIDTPSFHPKYYRPGAGIEVVVQLLGVGSREERRSFDLDDQNLGGHSNPISRFDRDNLRLYHLPGQGRSLNPSETPYSRPAGPAELVVRGQIANLREEVGYNRWRVGVSFRSDEPARPLIAQFIAQRQAQILRELRELTEMLGHLD